MSSKSRGQKELLFMSFLKIASRDSFALRCVLPEIREIPEKLLDVPHSLVSKSAKKNCTLREVAGRQIGRVQYFINRELKHLSDCGKIGNHVKG